MNIEIFTRSNKPELYAMAADFWPKGITAHQLTGYDHWTDAARFLWDVIGQGNDIAVVCDEDCFITDWKAVETLCEYLKGEGYTHAGMPDGGVSPHRCLSWVVTNPFFLVLNIMEVRKALERKRYAPELINQHGFTPEMERHRPVWITDKFNHGNQEPYNGLFYYLARYGKPFFLPAWTHPDGISTALRAPSGEVFALHSWYSREYGHDEKHTKRIKLLYNEARDTRSLSK